MEAKSLRGHNMEVREERNTDPEMSMVPPVQPPAGASGGKEGNQATTLPTLPGVRYSQPERYQP
jgi:hypothetical protein